MDGEKVTCGTKGDLVSKWKQSMKLAVDIKCQDLMYKKYYIKMYN